MKTLTLTLKLPDDADLDPIGNKHWLIASQLLDNAAEVFGVVPVGIDVKVESNMAVRNPRRIGVITGT